MRGVNDGCMLCGEGKAYLIFKGHSVEWVQFSSVQSLSRVWLFATPWIAVCQAFLSINNSWNLLKLMSIESMMLSNHLILCHPLFLLQSFPASRSFQMSQLFASGGQHIGVSHSGKNPPANAGDARDADSIPGSRRSPGEGNGSPLEYFCLKNPMDRGASWATVHGIAKRWTWPSDFTFTFFHTY